MEISMMASQTKRTRASECKGGKVSQNLEIGGRAKVRGLDGALIVRSEILLFHVGIGTIKKPKRQPDRQARIRRGARRG